MYEGLLAVNYPAPTFIAPAYHEGSIAHKVSLEDYKGKWVLLFFYPLDFTFVCPTELYELAKLQEEFDAANCQILGVSVDSVFSHQAWAKQDEQIGAIKFPLVSDLNREISMMYDVLHDDGMSLRGAFLIDPDGVLQMSMVNNLNVGRNPQELLRLLHAYQTGDLCQVNFKKGDQSLGKA